VNFVITPFGPYSFVWDGVAIGGIRAYGETLTRFGFLMNVAQEFAVDEDGEEKVSEKIRDGQEVLHARLVDAENLVLPQVPEILRAVALVRKAHDEGHTILVTCMAGRNRSGVVAAEHLIQLGNDPREVVEAIQTRRDLALTNRSFVRWLLRSRA